MNLRTAFLTGTVLLAACGGQTADSTLSGFQPAPITASNASTWVGFSAPHIYFYGILPLFLGASSGTADPTCPMQSSNGSQTTLSGGCTDRNGLTYSGTLTESGGAAFGIPASLQYNNWSVSRMCMGQTSTVTANGSFSSTASGGATNFSVNLTLSGNGVDVSTMTNNMMTTCTVNTTNMGTFAVDYSGSFTGSAMFGSTAPPSTWNGSGRIGWSTFGVVNASTSNESLNGMMCQYTPLSGTTTISSGSDTAVVTYQGATTCDSMASASWTLNGAAQANLTGVSCDVGHGTGTRRGSSFVLGAFAASIALLGARRRRRAA